MYFDFDELKMDSTILTGHPSYGDHSAAQCSHLVGQKK